MKQSFGHNMVTVIHYSCGHLHKTCPGLGPSTFHHGKKKRRVFLSPGGVITDN